MISTGRKLSGTQANVTGIGAIAWTNPTNAATSNDSRATATLTGLNVISNWLQLTNFNFNIPSDARIDGIVAESERRESATFVVDLSLRLVRGGVIEGTGKARVEEWATSDEIVRYGGPRDKWGGEWTAAEINNSGFGIAIAARSANSGSKNAEVDTVWLTVYYTRPGSNQLVVCKLRSGTPPHEELITIHSPEAVKYGLALGQGNTASFALPVTHSQMGEIDDIVHDETMPMVTIETVDGALEYAGFVTHYDDEALDAWVMIQLGDHFIRAGSALCPPEGGGDASSGALWLQALRYIDQNSSPATYLDYSAIEQGPGASYAFKLQRLDALRKSLQDQSGWDAELVHSIEPQEVRTQLVWQGSAGDDRRGDDIWETGTHFTKFKYGINFLKGLDRAVVDGGVDGTRQQVAASRRGVQSGVTTVQAPEREGPGMGGSLVTHAPEVSSRAALERMARSRLDAPENAAVSMTFTLLEAAIDRLALGVGDYRRVRYPRFGGRLVESDVRIAALNFAPGSGEIECVVTVVPDE